MMDVTTLYGPTVSVGITVALVEVAKSSGLPTKYAPLAALGSGVVWSLLIGWGVLHQAPLETVAAGIVAGLVASGAYSGVRALSGQS